MFVEGVAAATNLTMEVSGSWIISLPSNLAADRCGKVGAAVIQSATTKHKQFGDPRNVCLDVLIGRERKSATGHWVRASRA